MLKSSLSFSPSIFARTRPTAAIKPPCLLFPPIPPIPSLDFTNCSFHMLGENIADQLLILNQTAKGYLARLSYHRVLLTTPTHPQYPALSLDPKNYKNIQRIIHKKWPEIQSENLSVCDQYPKFCSQATLVLAELNDIYQTFCLVHDWFPKTLSLLGIMLTPSTNLDVTTAQFTFTQLLTLITHYIKLNMMLHASVAQYKLVTSIYSHACLAITDMTREPVSYNYLSKLLTSLSSTITSKIVQDFQPIATPIGRLLISLQPIHQRLTNLRGLDSSGALDVMSNTNAMSYPALKHDVMYRQFSMYEHYREWVVLGYLTCPNVLTEPVHMDWLSSVLKDGWMLHIYRDELSVSMHSLWVEMFQWYPKRKSGIKFMKKPKKIIASCETQSVDACLAIHGERRRFCARILERLCTIMAHTPGLVAPKCGTIFAALALTKVEIIWYYQHLNQAHCLSSKKLSKKITNQYGGGLDANISTLMHYMYTLTTHVRSYRMLVGRYYHEYLYSTHVNALEELNGKNTGSSNEKILVADIVQALMSMPAGDHVNVTVDLRPVRMAWWRHETQRMFGNDVHDHDNDTKEAQEGGGGGGGGGGGRGLIFQRAAISSLSSAMERIITHTTWVDELEQTVRSVGDLHVLWWCRNAIDEEYTDCLQSPNARSLKLVSFLNIYKSAASNLYDKQYYANDVLPVQASTKVKEYLKQAAQAVVSSFRPLFKDVEYMSNQTSYASTAQHLYMKTFRKQDTNNKNKRTGEENQLLPGDESRLPHVLHHQRVRSLVSKETIAKNICRALTSLRNTDSSSSDGSKLPGFLVHKTIYYPSVVIREQLRTLVSQSIRTITTAGKNDSSSSTAPTVLRPSALLKRVKHVMTTLHRIATTSITHDVERIVREELLRNCYDHRYAPGVMGEMSDTINAVGSSNTNASQRIQSVGTATDAHAMVHGYGRQYIHLIETLLTNTNDDAKQNSGIVWSSFKQGFIRTPSSSSSSSSSSSEVPHVEEYATLSEWMALCELIGPQGMRCIEHSMYHLIAGHATTVRAFLSTNRSQLESICSMMMTSSHMNAAAIVQTAMQLEMTSDMLRCSISMGHALKMRELIREATRRVLAKKIPLLYETVKTGFGQYGTNYSLQDQHVPMDRLARECGFDVGPCDHQLIACMSQLRSDTDDDDLWSLLPYAYGALFTSKYWILDKKGVQYVSSVSAMTNNSHVLITAVDSLITCFTALKIKHSGAAQTHRASTNNGVVLNPLEIEKKKFVECAAYILLYMRSLEHTKEWKLYPVRSMFVILEQFVLDGHLDRSILNRIVAHNLLHSALVEMSIGKNRGMDSSRKSAEAFLDEEEQLVKLTDEGAVRMQRHSSVRRQSLARK